MLDSLNGQRVLLTGANGFIGSHLLGALQTIGAEVTVLGRDNENLASLRARSKCVHTVQADLISAASTAAAVAPLQPQIVFHLAGYTNVGRGMEHAVPAMQTNLLGTINLVNGLKAKSVKRFIAVGSSEEYGLATAPFDETMPLAPVSHYAASKAAVSHWCRMVHSTLGFPTVVLRVFLAYGPGDRSDRLIPSAITAALRGEDFPMTSGRQTRELTYIDDLVQGFLRAAVAPSAVGEIINLGTGVEHPVREIVQKIYGLAGKGGRPLFDALPHRNGELWHNYASVDKATELLNWRAQVGIDEGLARTVAHYRSL
ncbi:NAD-dependent epimerase/dehydratase family protein [Halochromatium glycolicum]|uniref:NAD-dependent epimerase/dehydratase family protein n=1 Tax=Halochromatium glycolicum TaxID=85075 RepID=UPI001909978E